MTPERDVLIIEAMKLVNFLTNNQLVQANAIQCKVEAILKKAVMVPGTKPDESPSWGAYHCAIRIRNFILSGSTTEALKTARELGKQL